MFKPQALTQGMQTDAILREITDKPILAEFIYSFFSLTLSEFPQSLMQKFNKTTQFQYVSQKLSFSSLIFIDCKL